MPSESNKEFMFLNIPHPLSELVRSDQLPFNGMNFGKQKVYIHMTTSVYIGKNKMEESISVRIPNEEMKELDKISSNAQVTKSAILREVLRLGIKQKKLEIALDKFQKNEVTVAKAAHIAGISISEFLEVLHDRGINFHYGVGELREDFERIIKYDK